MLRLLTLLLSCAAVCAQPVLSLNDPTVVAKSSSLLQGLVGYWQLEEASGTRYDRSPYGNHLTSNNNVGSATGIVGKCGTFLASSSQSLSITSTPSLELGNKNYTLTAWWFRTVTNNDSTIIAKMPLNSAGDANAGEYSLRSYSDNYIYFATGYGSGNYNLASSVTIPTNVWTFVCSWSDKTDKKIYLQINNGTVASLNAPNGGYTNTALSFYIGRDNANVSKATGSIDEVGVWSRVLTSTERTKLYRSGLGVTYPCFSMRDNRADDFNWDTWEPLYEKPKPFPTLYAFVNRREPEPLLTICE